PSRTTVGCGMRKRCVRSRGISRITRSWQVWPRERNNFGGLVLGLGVRRLKPPLQAKARSTYRMGSGTAAPSARGSDAPYFVFVVELYKIAWPRPICGALNARVTFTL